MDYEIVVVDDNSSDNTDLTMNKFISENTLMDQLWIMDPDKKVKEVLKSINNNLKVVDFIRFKVGEGI